MIFCSQTIFIAEGKNNACRNFYVKLGRLRNDQVHGPSVTKGRSQTSHTRSLNDRTCFCPMPIVTWVTPGTVDVRLVMQHSGSEIKKKTKRLLNLRTSILKLAFD